MEILPNGNPPCPSWLRLNVTEGMKGAKGDPAPNGIVGGRTELMGGRRHQGGVFRGNPKGFPSSSLGSSWKKEEKETRDETLEL